MDFSAVSASLQASFSLVEDMRTENALFLPIACGDGSEVKVRSGLEVVARFREGSRLT